MKTTIYDVAKEANVSISTVSKVLNNTGNISEKTKNRI
ncbi:LacI family DNA-binding transcriptional regulator [Bacillus stercoris]|nr:LacI family DNA-binding transcriptional regulator [Bacillus stercoris]